MPPEDKRDGFSANPIEAFRSMSDAWMRGSQAFAETGQKIFGDFAKAASAGLGSGLGGGFGGVSRPPSTPGLDEAQKAYAASMKAATDLAASLAGAFPASGGEGGAAFFSTMFDPQAWTARLPGMDGGSLAVLTGGPQLADTGQVERKFAAVYLAADALRQRGIEHQTVMTQAWARAAGTFSKRLGELAAAGKAPSAWREATNLWLQVANDELIETQRSEAYLRSQRELLKASMELRLAQQEIAAYYGEMFGLPTRVELDDVHKTLTELRREMRALRRQASRARGQD